jgi:hypothetical protein
MLLVAFIQRVVNGGAMIIEEFGSDDGRVDILFKYAG